MTGSGQGDYYNKSPVQRQRIWRHSLSVTPRLMQKFKVGTIVPWHVNDMHLPYFPSPRVRKVHVTMQWARGHSLQVTTHILYNWYQLCEKVIQLFPKLVPLPSKVVQFLTKSRTTFPASCTTIQMGFTTSPNSCTLFWKTGTTFSVIPLFQNVASLFQIDVPLFETDVPLLTKLVPVAWYLYCHLWTMAKNIFALGVTVARRAHSHKNNLLLSKIISSSQK